MVIKARLALHQFEVLLLDAKAKALGRDPFDRNSTKLLASEEHHVWIDARIDLAHYKEVAFLVLICMPIQHQNNFLPHAFFISGKVIHYPPFLAQCNAKTQV